MEKNKSDMTKFNFTAGMLFGLLERYVTVEDKTAINVLTCEIYEAARDLVFAFEYGVDLCNGDKKSGAWSKYLATKNELDD